MEQSHFVRSLRITFLTVGFLAFVFMAAHWVQHVSTAKPVLTPQIIAVQHVNGLIDQKSAVDMRQSSIVSFVQPTSGVIPPKVSTNHQLSTNNTAVTPASSQSTSRYLSGSIDLPVVTNLNNGVNAVLKTTSSSDHAHLPRNTAP
jgi:hypothetical protein